MGVFCRSEDHWQPAAFVRSVAEAPGSEQQAQLADTIGAKVRLQCATESFEDEASGDTLSRVECACNVVSNFESELKTSHGIT